MNTSRVRRFLVAVIFVTWLAASPVGQCMGESASESGSLEKEGSAEAIKAGFNYPDLEPKQLFQLLSGIYQVQFEGGDALTGRITLVSKGKVDLKGMLVLLNEVLAKQNMTAQTDGKVVRILPIKDLEDTIIRLRYADPKRVVEILRELFLPTAKTTAEEKVRKLSFIDVHPQLQAVIVRGPNAVLKEIEAYVHEQLDISSDTSVPEKGGGGVGQGPDVKAPLVRKYLSLEYLSAEEFTSLMDKDDEIKGTFVSVIAPNNTVVISTSDASIFTRIEQMKKAFDVDRMEIRYIPLHYAQAVTMKEKKNSAEVVGVADLIEAVYPKKIEPLPEELQQIRNSLGLSGRAEDMESEALRDALLGAGISDPDSAMRLSRSLGIVSADELTIVPDPERNGLIIRTFSRNFPKILELIAELDKPRPQVLIDMFITEVSLDDTTELGLDFTNIQTSGGTVSTTAQSFTSLLSSAETGLTYELVSDNITAYIRALQQTGKLDIITRPQITTKNNTPARIALGRDVPIVDTTIVSTEGASQSTVKYANVQTILEVIPQIHPDGYVSLNISQTIDDIGTETFQISEQFNPQVIIRRSANTHVRVKDGQTVCLGGFIGDSISEKISKVPILGELPLLGALFQYSSKEREKKELILFITPYVLRTSEEVLEMTNKMREMSHTEARPGRSMGILDVQPSVEVLDDRSRE